MKVGDIIAALSATTPMLSTLPIFFAAMALPSPGVSTMSVRITGPIALVEVNRALEATRQGESPTGKETVLDLTLPEGARFVDGSISYADKTVPLTLVSPGQASAAYAQTLASAKITAKSLNPDDGSDARVRMAGRLLPAVVRYRFVAPLSCKDGGFVLHLPENLDENPKPIPYSVTLDGLPVGQSLAWASASGSPVRLAREARRFHATGEAPARGNWDIEFRLTARRETRQGTPILSQLLASRRGKTESAPAWQAVTFCRDRGAVNPERPSQALFLLDQSASMGRGSIANVQATAQAIAKRLPPSTWINAVRFHHSTDTLYPQSRIATDEVLGALGQSLDPNRLGNGTDLVAALGKAKSLISVGSPAEGPAWLVILTDGDLPSRQTAQAMKKALEDLGKLTIRVLVLFVRPDGDDEIPSPNRRIFADLVQEFGGLLRKIPSGNPDDVAKVVLAAMDQGGDLVELFAGETFLTDSVLPGDGKTFHWSGGPPPARLRGRWRDGSISRQIPWAAAPHGSRLLSSDPKALLAQTSDLTVAIIPQFSLPANDGFARGQMDPQVLRNALSLAFMPRARACYLSRRVVNSKDMFLQGRIRLQLTLSRGELHDAVILSSTLGNPVIDTCVQNAAQAIEYPRPSHRDALTVANLNLVFRPYTPEATQRDASALDREIELILGPLQFAGDASPFEEFGK